MALACFVAVPSALALGSAALKTGDDSGSNNNSNPFAQCGFGETGAPGFTGKGDSPFGVGSDNWCCGNTTWSSFSWRARATRNIKFSLASLAEPAAAGGLSNTSECTLHGAAAPDCFAFCFNTSHNKHCANYSAADEWTSWQEFDPTATVPGRSAPHLPTTAAASDGSLPYLLDFLSNAGVKARVNVSETQVETPLLTSTAGTVVTLLNWRTDPIDSLSILVTTSHEVEAVTAAQSGAKLKFTSTRAADGSGFVIAFAMPLVHCDFVTLPVKKSAIVAPSGNSTSITIKTDDVMGSFPPTSPAMTAAERVAQATDRNPKCMLNGSWALVSCWGYDPLDSTEFIQAALDSGAPNIVLPSMCDSSQYLNCSSKGAWAWLTRPLVIRSNTVLHLQAGVELWAKRGAFHGSGDSVLTLSHVSNVTVLGYGARIKMWREDYANQSLYSKSEWRHCISVTAATNLSIVGVTLAESGGDGIAIGGEGAHWPAVSVSRNVYIKDVLATANFRQGISIMGAVDMLVEDSRFELTGGTAPMCGVDIEPNTDGNLIQNLTFRRVSTRGNSNCGWSFQVAALTAPPPIGIVLEQCVSVADREYLDPRSRLASVSNRVVCVADCNASVCSYDRRAQRILRWRGYRSYCNRYHRTSWVRSPPHGRTWATGCEKGRTECAARSA